MASCLFYFYYKAGRFSNTYAEIHDEMEQRDLMSGQVNENTERLDSGRWFTNKLEMYHTLSFEPGNNIVIRNSIDTVLRYTYFLNENTLWLITNGKDSISNKITQHNNEELIFEGLLNNQKDMRYGRISR